MSQKGSHVKPKTVRSPAPRKRRRRRRGGSVLRTVLITVLAVLLVLGIGGYLVFHHFWGFVNTPDKTARATPTPAATPAATAVSDSTPAPADTPEPTETPEPTPEPPTPEEIAAMEEQRLRDEMQSIAEEVLNDKNVYNILLLGADDLGSGLERTDAMILLSINKETKEVWLTSFMRDTQVSLCTPDGRFYSVGHLNWATSWGNNLGGADYGIQMLISTIESPLNFAIKIDNWAVVNFIDFAKVASLLGPIYVTVDSWEAATDMNTLIRQVCWMIDENEGLTGENVTPRVYFDHGAGDYVLTDGIQILAYCRERKVGGDTGRSEKQRDALMQMWENFKKLSLKEQKEVMEAALSIITTDLTEGQCISLLLQAPQFINSEINGQQCPPIGAFTKTRDASNLSIYNADFNVCRNFLQATIYGEPLTAGELTSWWTGNPVLVYDPNA